MNYIFTKEQYISAKAAWSKITSHTPADHIIYNAIRGFDLKRGFSEITNPVKLENGAHRWHGFACAHNIAQQQFKPIRTYSATSARANLQDEIDLAYANHCDQLSARFGFDFTPEVIETMREVLK